MGFHVKRMVTDRLLSNLVFGKPSIWRPSGLGIIQSERSNCLLCCTCFLVYLVQMLQHASNHSRHRVDTDIVVLRSVLHHLSTVQNPRWLNGICDRDYHHSFWESLLDSQSNGRTQGSELHLKCSPSLA